MDTVFFIVGKLVGAFIRVDTWIVLALGMIVLALLFQRRRLAIGVSAMTFAVLLALTILPLGAFLLQPIERRFPVNPLLPSDRAVSGCLSSHAAESLLQHQLASCPP